MTINPQPDTWNAQGSENPGSFSVVVPTYGRVRQVQRLLESLSAARSHHSGAVEVLIIDDSPPEQAAALRKLCAKHAARYIAGPGNVREKRNLGVIQSAHEYIFFVDSDCWVTPDIFRAYNAVYATHPTAGGAAGPVEFVGASSFVWSVISQSQFVQFANAAYQGKEVDWAACANVSFKRSTLEKIGLFDTSLPFRLGGDDVDLCLRAKQWGLPLLSATGAVVYHERETWASWPAILKRTYRWGRVEYHLCKRHLSLRRLTFPRFWVVAALMLLAGILKALLAQQTLWLLLPVTWFVLSLALFSVMDFLSARPRPADILPRLCAALPELTYQFGLCLEALARGDVAGMCWGLYPAANWAETVWQPELCNMWANLLALLGAWLWINWLISVMK
ncbi:MAG TPA: glycosyltransferase [Ktedonobacteraceae bacterium]|nr:glycosyltransferase [Ktedonobacteraceae bacterium]